MSSSQGTVGGLRVAMDPDPSRRPSSSPVQIDPDSSTFKAVQACAHLALTFMESTRGKDALCSLAELLYQNRQAKLINWYSDNRKRKTQMMGEVDLFLRRTREDFPNILLTYHIAGEAKFVPLRWGTDARQWTSKNSGSVLVHKLIVENLVYAGENAAQHRSGDRITADNYLENFEIGMFNAAVSIAHELVHSWVRLLNGLDGGDTPTHVMVPGAATTPGRGESGWWFESKMFGGGMLATIEDRASPLAVNRQSGSLCWEQEGSNVLVRVSRTYIQDFLKLRFSSPIKLSNDRPIQHRDARILALLRPGFIPSNSPSAVANIGTMNRMPAFNVRLPSRITPAIFARN